MGGDSGAAGVTLLATRGSEKGYLHAGGVRLRYTAEGDGPPVLLLHGFAVSGDLKWRLSGTIKSLRRRYLVITPDLRGHGRNDRPRGPEAYRLYVWVGSLAGPGQAGVSRSPRYGWVYEPVLE